MKYFYGLSLLALTSCSYLLSNPELVEDGTELVEEIVESLENSHSVTLLEKRF